MTETDDVEADVARRGSDGGEGTWARANWVAPAAIGETGRITAYPVRGVWLITVDGPYADVGDELDHALQLALAESPRGVVCTLLHPLAGAPEDAVDLLASAGRHVRAWPATPVVIACKDPDARALLVRRPDGRLLGHASSMLQGWAQIMAAAAPLRAQLHLHPDALSPRAARSFLTRTCLDWAMAQHLSAGPLVISELVTNAVEHARTTIDVLLAGDGPRLRIGVRDGSPTAPVTRAMDAAAPSGRGLRLVQAMAGDSGAMPASDGGKFVWAVLGH